MMDRLHLLIWPGSQTTRVVEGRGLSSLRKFNYNESEKEGVWMSLKICVYVDVYVLRIWESTEFGIGTADTFCGFSIELGLEFNE